MSNPTNLQQIELIGSTVAVRKDFLLNNGIKPSTLNRAVERQEGLNISPKNQTWLLDIAKLTNYMRKQLAQGLGCAAGQIEAVLRRQVQDRAKLANMEVMKRQAHLRSNLKRLVSPSPESMLFFRESGFNDLQVNDLAMTEAWARFLVGVDNTTAKALGFKNRKALYEQAASDMLSEGFHNWKVSNYRKFNDKLNPWKDWRKAHVANHEYEDRFLETARRSLISNQGKSKTATRFNETQKNWVLGFYLQNNGGPKMTYDAYLVQCGIEGWHPVGISTVKKYLNCPELQPVIAKYKFGTQDYKQAYEPHVRRAKPNPNVVWSMDGQSTDLLCRVRRKVEGKVKWVEAQLVLFAIADVATGAILGWWISQRENRWMVRQAMKRALQVTGNRLPLEIQTDNGSAIRESENQKIWEATGATMRWKPKPQRGSNEGYDGSIIESLWMDMNRLYRELPNWTGGNVDAKDRYWKANTERLSAEVDAKRIPTEKEMRTIIDELVIIHNSKEWKDGKSRLAHFQEGIDERCPVVDDFKAVQMFDAATMVRPKQGHITFTVDHEEQVYVVPDWNQWYHLSHEKVRVRYDLSAMDEVRVWRVHDTDDESQDEYLFTAESLERSAYAYADQDAEERRKLAKQQAAKKAMRQRVEEQKEALDDALLDDFGLKVPFVSREQKYKDALQSKEAQYLRQRLCMDHGEAGIPGDEEVSVIDNDRERRVIGKATL